MASFTFSFVTVDDFRILLMTAARSQHLCLHALPTFVFFSCCYLLEFFTITDKMYDQLCLVNIELAVISVIN